MNAIFFIGFVICICLGLFILNSENHIFEEWMFILLAVVLIVCGCMGAGDVLFHLVN